MLKTTNLVVDNAFIFQYNYFRIIYNTEARNIGIKSHFYFWTDKRFKKECFAERID